MCCATLYRLSGNAERNLVCYTHYPMLIMGSLAPLAPSHPSGPVLSGTYLIQAMYTHRFTLYALGHLMPPQVTLHSNVCIAYLCAVGHCYVTDSCSCLRARLLPSGLALSCLLVDFGLTNSPLADEAPGYHSLLRYAAPLLPLGRKLATLIRCSQLFLDAGCSREAVSWLVYSWLDGNVYIDCSMLIPSLISFEAPPLPHCRTLACSFGMSLSLAFTHTWSVQSFLYDKYLHCLLMWLHSLGDGFSLEAVPWLCHPWPSGNLCFNCSMLSPSTLYKPSSATCAKTPLEPLDSPSPPHALHALVVCCHHPVNDRLLIRYHPCLLLPSCCFVVPLG